MNRMQASRRSSLRALFTVAVGLIAGCSDSTGTSASADLVALLAGPATGAVGATLDYTITVRNDGPDAGAGIVPRVTLGGAVAFASASDGGSASAGTVTWPAIASLASGAEVTRTLSVTVSGIGSATLAAAASGTVTDPQAGNSDGSGTASRVAVTGTAPPAADVSAVVSGTLGGANGATVTATITITNAGTLAAENVTATLAIPATVMATVTSPEPSTRAGGTISWSLGTMAVSATTQLTVEIVIPTAVSSTQITATATTTTTDAIPSNNNGSAPNARGIVRAVLTPLRSFSGEAAGDQFGWVTANLGDLNGDGVADFASTAPTNDAGGVNAGRVYVYSGASGAELFRVTGDVANAQLGFSVDAVGDLNGDGTEDLVIGAAAINTTMPGFIVAVSGTNGSELYRLSGLAPGEAFGYGVGRYADMNGDGVMDFLVGAPGRSPGGVGGAGVAVVVSGATGAVISTRPGTVAGGLLGAGLRGVGDLNGDGVHEYAVGAFGQAGGGAIYVINGATGASLFPAFQPPSGGSQLGQFWVNTPGDVDGDGTNDIFGVDFGQGVGNSQVGQAYVISGANGSLIRTFTGEGPGDQFGIGRGIGDITGDGRPDFILAAWRRTEGASNAGKIYLVNGATGAILRSFVSITSGETLGFDAIGLGDVNGDGLQDYLVTGGQEINQGRAYIVAGVPIP